MQPQINKFDKPYMPQQFIDTTLCRELFNIVKKLNTTDLLEYSLKHKISLDQTDEFDNNLIHAIIQLDPLKASEDTRLYIIKFLIHNDVNPDKANKNNQSPLHLACEEQYSKIVKYLLETGVESNLQDNMGNTPFHYLLAGKIRTCKNNCGLKLFVSDLTSNTIIPINKLKEVYIDINIINNLLEYGGNPYIKNLEENTSIHPLLKLYNYKILGEIKNNFVTEYINYENYKEIIKKTKQHMKDKITRPKTINHISFFRIIETQYRNFIIENKDYDESKLIKYKDLFRLCAYMIINVIPCPTIIETYFEKSDCAMRKLVFCLLYYLLYAAVYNIERTNEIKKTENDIEKKHPCSKSIDDIINKADGMCNATLENDKCEADIDRIIDMNKHECEVVSLIPDEVKKYYNDDIDDDCVLEIDPIKILINKGLSKFIYPGDSRRNINMSNRKLKSLNSWNLKDSETHDPNIIDYILDKFEYTFKDNKNIINLFLIDFDDKISNIGETHDNDINDFNELYNELDKFNYDSSDTIKKLIKFSTSLYFDDKEKEVNEGDIKLKYKKLFIDLIKRLHKIIENIFKFYIIYFRMIETEKLLN